MRYLIAIVLCGLFNVMFSQQSKILVLVNTSFPVTHDNVSQKIIDRNTLNRDSMDMQIISRVGYFILRDLDTSHYVVSRRTIEQLGGKSEDIYPFINYDDIRSPYVRPKMDKLQSFLKEDYDYIVSVNKIDFLRDWGTDKIKLWVSLYDGSYTEITSKRFSSKIDIKKTMLPSALLQVIHEPCEEIEERILTQIDNHIKRYMNCSSYDAYLANNTWVQGTLRLWDGDSIRGEVNYDSPYQLRYRISKESPERTFSAQDVKEIDFMKMHYRTIFVPHVGNNLGKNAMARIISDGKIKLYEIEHEGLTRYYISDDNDTKHLLRVRLTPDFKRINNRQAISSFFGENEEFIEQIFQKKFGIKDLEKLVYQYNSL